jgi:hypothetical protein
MTARATRVFTATVLAAACAFAAPSLAQDDESRFSGIFQLDTTNAYFFRGILQEREGIVFEPWGELYYSLYSSETGFLRDVTIGAGMWNSFHSERTLAGMGTDGGDQNQWWYEADYYPLISLGFQDGVSLTTYYFFYTSPNDAFTTAQELNFRLAWDDSEAFGDWSMQPWMNLAIETVNTAFGPQEGTGLQLGIGPTLYAAEDESFTLTLPVEAGFSLEDYYEGSNAKNHGFGYAAAGLAASIPLTFVPEGAGAWSLGLAAKYYFFGHILEDANRGRSTYPVGTLSLAVEF